MSTPKLNIEELKKAFENGLVWQHDVKYIWSWFSQKYISAYQEGRKEERQRIISILLDNKNFTWIDQEGTNLISEIIKKI